MSHFYGNMKGSRGETTRCGTKNSGIRCHVRGWNYGIKVIIQHYNGKDIVSVWETGGSNGHNPDRLVYEGEEP